MQHLRAWARNRAHLITAVCSILGAIVLAATWIGHPPAAIVDETPVQELVETTAEADAEISASPTTVPTPIGTVIVYISGAVRLPDVYQLPGLARIKDLVLAAGGLTAQADAEQINLAERMSDGQHIHIPRQGEGSTLASASPNATSGAASQPGKLVNINTASAAELEGLPGIGQSFAERIVEYRTANDPFKSVEDLRSVKGIGPALFSKIAPLITVGP
jgi:competence protein ComEA